MSSHVTMIPEGLHKTLIGTTDPGREASLRQSRDSESGSLDRALCVPADHPIVKAWETRILPPLMHVIKESDLRMNHIDVIRLYRPTVGLSPEAQAREEDQAPVVVYIGVAKDVPQSLNDPVKDHPEGAVDPAFTDRTKLFLGKANFMLEMYRVVSKSLYPETVLGPVFFEVYISSVEAHSSPFLPDSPLSPTRKHETPFQLSVGMDIAVITKPNNHRGTGDVFVQLQGRPGIFLLTCGHVLADVTTRERSPHSALPGASVMFLSRDSYRERIDKLTIEQDRHRNTALAQAAIRALGQSGPSEAGMDPERQLADQQERLLQRLNGPAWRDKANRVIGKVLCFPRGGQHIEWSPRGWTETGSEYGPGGLRLGFEDDWGLIQLDQQCLTPGFKANFIPIVDPLPVAPRVSAVSPPFSPFPEVFDGDSLRVSGIAPFSDFHDKPTRVFKRGAATGETVGTINSIKSVRREYFPKGFNDNGQTTHYEWHVDTLALLVVGTSGPFSRRGDSGSAVIDEHGRVLAMVFGGPINDNDVSYATPMEFIFDRIRKVYALEPSLVPTSPSLTLLTTARTSNSTSPPLLTTARTSKSTSPSLLTTARTWLRKKIWG